MRLRKAPFTEFKRIYTTLESFFSETEEPILIVNGIPDVKMELKENDLISFINPICPQCSSRNVSKNGTCNRITETGAVLRVQKYICNDCRYSFVARPPNYGYGKHISHEVKSKTTRGRVKTSLRKIAYFFRLIGDVSISHETIRKNVPGRETKRMASSGYFVYDEQYAHIDGQERYRALLKDSKTRLFYEEMLDDLKDETLVAFFLNALSRFDIPDDICVTTDGYHYGSVLESVERKLSTRISRQRCLFHIEKDLAHKIKEEHKEKDLDLAKRLVKFMFFQTPGNLKKIGSYSGVVSKNIEDKSERETVQYVISILNNYYGDDPIISKFLSFLKDNRKEVFLYLKNGEVEKTSDIAEQHFSIQSWLFKHRFKTKEGLMRTSFWYHRYLSTGF